MRHAGSAAFLLACTVALGQQPAAAEHLAALAEARGRAQAMRALVAMGKAALPHLEPIVAAANDGKASPVLPHVFAVLARIGPEAAGAQPLLRTYLKQGAEEHLFAAICAYADLAAYAPHREKVGANLWHDDTTLINHAVRRLPRSDLKTAAGFRDFVAAQSQYLRVNQRVRVFTEHGEQSSVATMAQIVERDLWFQREVAAEHLGRMGADARPALAALAKALRRIHDPDGGIATQMGGRPVVVRDDFGPRAAEAILCIDADAAAAAAAHAFLIGHSPDPQVRMDALAHLSQRPQQAEDVMPILIGWLVQGGEGAVPAEVVNVLGALGAAGKAAIPALEALVAAGRQPDARYAAIALRQITGK